MCGIVGFTGTQQAAPILLSGLSKLEYRGYDSAGIAVRDGDKLAEVVKAKGRLGNLAEKTDEGRALRGTCGIGHTRWATHGEPSQINAHPHVSGNCTRSGSGEVESEVVGVHNGIIENYQELKDKLIRNGYEFYSSTDTEVAVKLVDYYYKKYLGTPVDAINHAMVRIRGSYALAIMFKDYPGEIYAIRNVSPLVAAYTRSGSFVASDLTALIPYTRQYFVVPEDHIVRLTSYKVHLYNLQRHEEMPELMEVNWNMDAAMKNGFPHFMLKEIHEQPEALRNTILPRLSKGLPDFTDDQIPDDVFTSCSQIHIVACGTAMHAGMAARSMMEPLLRIPVTVSVASEFRYEEPLIGEDTLVIIISQSGETIDTLAAMRLAKNYGAAALSVVNVKGSTIARESDYTLYTHAGPEIAVASTKAYSVQLAALYMIGCRMALVRGKYSVPQATEFMKKLLGAIPAMEAMIAQKDSIKALVTHLINKPDAFFIGRGLDYSFSLEGALKLKEISYIHAEAYAAGELKHGTIALITEEVPVIAIATQEKVFAKTISNIREVKARGAFVILITKEDAVLDRGVADIHIRIPKIGDRFTVFPIAVVLQLIAYYASTGKNLDVDQPRNLAKSVTVE